MTKMGEVKGPIQAAARSADVVKTRAEQKPMAAWSITYNGVCTGITKSGKPCGQRSVYGNGLCRHHGGLTSEAEVATYKERLIESSQRWMRRHLRRMGRNK